MTTPTHLPLATDDPAGPPTEPDVESASPVENTAAGGTKENSNEFILEGFDFSTGIDKPWTILYTVVRLFDQISLRTHNSSLEGATELKVVPFCSS